MKKCIAMVLTGVLAMSMLAGCGGGKTDSTAKDGGTENVKAVTLNMNVTTADTSVWHVAAKEFKRIVEEKTGGRYIINIYPNEQLASGDMVRGTEMITSGAIDVDLRSCVNFTAMEPKLYAVALPFLFDGYEGVDAVLFNGPAKDTVKELIDAKGVKVLALGENGFRQITNNKREIKTLDDLKGLKIRTAYISVMMDTLKALGTDPMAMSFSEVFTALQQGTIDGQENPSDPIMSSKLYEVQKYLTRWNYSYDCLVLSVGQHIWSSLSEEDRAIFQEAAEAGCKMQIEQSRKDEETNFAFFEEQGMQITTLTEEERQQFKSATKGIYEQYKDIIGEDVMKEFGYTFE